MAKIDFLKKRAREFLKLSKHAFREGNYNISAFNLEQAAQLYLKYYLFLRIKDYPKTHSLEELLRELVQAYPEKKSAIGKILKEEVSAIGDLEQAYITSRYLPTEFSKNRIKEMQKFVAKLFKFLKGL